MAVLSSFPLALYQKMLSHKIETKRMCELKRVVHVFGIFWRDINIKAQYYFVKRLNMLFDFTLKGSIYFSPLILLDFFLFQIELGVLFYPLQNFHLFLGDSYCIKCCFMKDVKSIKWLWPFGVGKGKGVESDPLDFSISKIDLQSCLNLLIDHTNPRFLASMDLLQRILLVLV